MLRRLTIASFLIIVASSPLQAGGGSVPDMGPWGGGFDPGQSGLDPTKGPAFGPMQGTDPFGGLESTPGQFSPGQGNPMAMPSMMGLPYGPGGRKGPFGRAFPTDGIGGRGSRMGGHGRGAQGQRPGRPPFGQRPPPPPSLLSPRLAMHWARLDAAGRTQMETMLRQWLSGPGAAQQSTLVSQIQQIWNRLPSFHQQFLSAVFNGGATTSSTGASEPTTTATTTTSTGVTPVATTTIDPTTGLAIDPATGFLIEPTSGYLYDRATATYYDRTTGYGYSTTQGVWFDPSTGQALTSATTSTATTAP